MRTNLISNGKRHHATLNVGDLASAFSTPPHPANQEHNESGDPGNKEYWSETEHKRFYGGIKSIADAEKILSAGWQEGTERLEGMRKAPGLSTMPGVRDRKRKMRWADKGDDLNVDRALRGDWDTAWRTTRREITTGTLAVDLYSSWGGNCDKTAEQMFWTGAVMLVACDLLENAGYRVRLVATMGTESHACRGSVSRIDVVLKDDCEPLRIDALAGIVCHAGIFRTAGFKEMLRAPFDLGSNLGHHIDIHSLPKELAITDPQALIIPDAYDQQTAIANIQDIVKRIQG